MPPAENENQKSETEPADITPDAVTFLMVGCQRCGSTWVDAALRGHPQIFLPASKQSYFFDQNYDRGLPWYLERFVDVAPEQRAVGEVATGYCLPHAVPKMAAHFPDIRLMMAMRHPIERAYSNFRTRRAEQNWSSFEDALESSDDLLERGHYMDQIECLLEFYPRERILLMLYDDLDHNDQGYLRAMLEFLEVDDTFRSDQIGQRKNAAAFPRLRTALHRVGLKPTLKALSRSPVGDAIRRRRKKSGGDPSRGMNVETRRRLLEHFQPHNKRLATFLGRDLSGWDT